MSWIDDINKKLEEQRNKLKEAKESGEFAKRTKSYAGKVSAQTEAGKLQKIKRKEAADKWIKENPEEYARIHKEKTEKMKANGTYKRAGRTLSKNILSTTTKEERSAKSKHANTFMDYERRCELAQKGNITRSSNREKKMQMIYDTIKLEGWFTAAEVLEAYDIQGNQGPMSIKSIIIYLNEKDWYESKFENFSSPTGGGRKKVYKKK